MISVRDHVAQALGAQTATRRISPTGEVVVRRRALDQRGAMADSLRLESERRLVSRDGIVPKAERSEGVRLMTSWRNRSERSEEW